MARFSLSRLDYSTMASSSGNAAEPRGLGMSLDDMITETRKKEEFKKNSNKHSQPKKGSSFGKLGGKFSSENRGGDGPSKRAPYVRVEYSWNTEDIKNEKFEARVDSVSIVTVNSSGDVVIHAVAKHDKIRFVALKECLAPVNLKVTHDNNLIGDWTIGNDHGWNRVLDSDV